jgi:DNA-binding transcriptional regulator WhiA
MNKREKFALFLGMLSGDGCLSLKHSGEGYRDYPIQFYNTDKNKIILFDRLFFDLFYLHGKITFRKRKNRKKIWEFLKYSKKTVEKLKNIGFPEGVKRDVLRIPKIIKKSSIGYKKYFLLGVLITDGCIKRDGTIAFHLGSKQFLEDLSKIIEEIIAVRKNIKEYVQKQKFKSYQLNLNKSEATFLLSKMPTWPNGKAPALRMPFLFNKRNIKKVDKIK